MKALFLAGIVLSGIWATASAQSDFSKALLTLNTNDLANIKPEGAEAIHRDFVLWTVQIARREKVRFDQEAAFELDKFYSDKSKVAIEASSDKKALLPTNTRRFVFRLVSYAEPDPKQNVLIIKRAN